MVEDDRMPAQPEPDSSHPSLKSERRSSIPDKENERDKDHIKERLL